MEPYKKSMYLKIDEIHIRSVVQLIVLCQNQLPGFDNVL